MLSKEMSLLPWFRAYRNRLDGWSRIAPGEMPALKGEPTTEVKAPDLLWTRMVATPLTLGKEANRR